MSHQVAAGKYDEMKQTFGFALRVVRSSRFRRPSG